MTVQVATGQATTGQATTGQATIGQTTTGVYNNIMCYSNINSFTMTNTILKLSS